MLTSWRDPDGAHGAVAIRLDRHRDASRTYEDRDALATIRWAVRRFRTSLPGPLRPGAVEWSGSFAGLEMAVRRTYSYGNGRGAGRVLIAAGYDRDDVAWVGAVYGPGAYVDEEGFQVFLSLTRREV